MAERVRVWEITSKEGNRLLRIVRRSTGSVVTWWRAQMVLLSAQGMLMGPTPCIRATAVAVRRSSPWPSAVDAQPGDP